ncbi:tRNA 2-selenouridine(34) synthase MnmH [Azohydromonas sediminis]|uniref:tRNA 2-selenouridine(34) synthase MnmH n=1 Tax=Azohydromonas sediminis TaxID=2259674 RepID=UPI000E64B713|nr:tRNA 2-selenouridine(34) synthase MnmH [Azohydromonas sediminis]
MAIALVEARAVADGTAGVDTVIDARSPAEFAEDHLPGAVNWPVLDDRERRVVGTLYKQVSPHEARKVGAAMVARRIADHLERWVAGWPREWRPLVYCWRGGQRSGSLAWFLDQIGFRTQQLRGGYKAFRGVVRADLDRLPAALSLHVLTGRTGSGKTRLLHALRAAGAQVLDLEALACHRGSVLGAVPGTPQPSQKDFETRLWQALRGLDPARPVFVESESRKIGALHLPDALIARMREHGRCIEVELALDGRIALLLEEYAFFTRDPEQFCRRLAALVPLAGHATVQRWQALARAGRWAEAFADLMEHHYDPLYERSMARHFAGRAAAPRLTLRGHDAPALAAAARDVLDLVARGDRSR